MPFSICIVILLLLFIIINIIITFQLLYSKENGKIKHEKIM